LDPKEIRNMAFFAKNLSRYVPALGLAVSSVACVADPAEERLGGAVEAENLPPCGDAGTPLQAGPSASGGYSAWGQAYTGWPAWGASSPWAQQYGSLGGYSAGLGYLGGWSGGYGYPSSGYGYPSSGYGWNYPGWSHGGPSAPPGYGVISLPNGGLQLCQQ
jgi:hypothetical protein